MGAPQPLMSPIRAAGMPPIRTVGQPGGTIGVGGCGGRPGNEQACSVPTVAAGIQTTPLSHQEVIDAGREAEPVISDLLARVIGQL